MAAHHPECPSKETFEYIWNHPCGKDEACLRKGGSDVVSISSPGTQ